MRHTVTAESVGERILTRNSADKPRDAFRSQSRSPNMVPFHVLGMVSYYLHEIASRGINRSTFAEVIGNNQVGDFFLYTMYNVIVVRKVWLKRIQRKTAVAEKWHNILFGNCPQYYSQIHYCINFFYKLCEFSC